MESVSNGGVAKDSFLKIDTVWSEAEENIETFAIKEEIISDLEPELNDDINKEENIDLENKLKKNEVNCDKTGSTQIAPPLQILKKRIKNKSQKQENELLDFSCNPKSSCVHDTKSFRIVNRRLRCGDCRSLVCPECFKIMFSTLHNHFLGFDTSNCNIYLCKFCSFPFHSICALQAHVRIHTMETPFVCPDCGLIYSNAYFLILHLINKCFHVYKIVSYKCPSCPNVYFSSETFSKHLQDFHLSCILRCSYCSLLFSNSEDFKNHVDSSHQKQKVQYLNYFRCNLCSDVVIPSFMYEKHINRHRENSESYDVEYQCLCGDVFSLIGAFRAHIQFCNKKGILPPHWEFLKKNLKSQDVCLVENGHKKTENLEAFKNTVNKLNENKLENFEYINRAMNKGKPSDGKKERLILFQNNLKDTMQSKHLNSDLGKAMKTKTRVASEANNTKSTTQMSQIFDSEENLNVPNGNECQESKNLAEINSEKSSSAEEKHIGNNEECLGEKHVAETDSDSCKMFYDYIPCDHMGYVKAQGPEPMQKESTDVKEEKKKDNLLAPNNYHIVMELDERTGLMVSKKIFTETIQDKADKAEEKENSFDNNVTSSNVEEAISYRLSSNEKCKMKLGTSFFTCPFCSVLFPKNSSTFQQFRLHLEYYHGDAALNIIVCDEKKSETNNLCPMATHPSPNACQNNGLKKNYFSSKLSKKLGGGKKTISTIDQRLEEESNRSRDDAIALQTNKCKIEGKEEGDGIGNDEADYDNGDIDEEDDDDENNENDYCDVDNYDDVVNDDDDDYDDDDDDNNEDDNCNNKNEMKEQKQTLTKAEQQNTCKKKTDSKRNFYWTVNLSVENLYENSGCESRAVKENSIDLISVKDVKSETGNRFNGTDTVGSRSSASGPMSHTGENEYIDGELKNKRCDLVEDEENLIPKEGKEGFSKRKKPSYILHNKSRESLSDPDYDWENSRDSSWSNGSDFEWMPPRDATEDILLRPKAVEKCKRESEVWSEFYESLQIAEKLKKNKRKNAESQLKEEKKCSTLTEYSAKRVVKKPKRYRESSESECRFDNIENSESEVETNATAVIRQGEETTNRLTDDDESFSHREKKQKLISKLKNIDQNLVDYLLDFITKKEKCFELYKKHSALVGGRHGQTLRSYRKKVLNGIKLRGRPLKLLRHDAAPKKYRSVSEKLEENQNLKDSGWQKTLRKLSDDQEGRSVEKKRGRPRKIIETVKLKERRRSNREVDFIEKNFEREESGSSPSKRKRKLSSKLQYYKKINLTDEKEDFSCGQLISGKTGDSGKKFNCAICKEVFEEPNGFREHIVSHRQEDNIYQCMECGECFVVRPSLEKHLHAFHKIRNTDQYIAENDCGNPKKEPCESETEILKENQCKVCKDQFERSIDLTKHFRIHGMAFLKEFKKDGRTKP